MVSLSANGFYQLKHIYAKSFRIRVNFAKLQTAFTTLNL